MTKAQTVETSETQELTQAQADHAKAVQMAAALQQGKKYLGYIGFGALCVGLLAGGAYLGRQQGRKEGSSVHNRDPLDMPTLAE